MTERKNFNLKKMFLICIVYIFVICSFRGFASEKIDTNADVSMTIEYKKDGKQISGATFQVYHVADVTESGEYRVKKAFENYPIPFSTMGQEEWQQYALTLSGYVKRDSIASIDSGVTDQNGILHLPTHGITMKPGLYLVVGKTRTIGRYTYYASPFLICLPGMNDQGIQNSYDVDIAPKSRSDYYDPVMPRNTGLIRKVLKVWNDAANEYWRPESITVQLLRDDKIYDTVVLNQKNNWRYTWYDLSTKYDWSVVEKEVDNYTVNIVQEGVTFVITNTYTPKRPDIPGGNTPGGNVPQGHDGPARKENSDIPINVLGKYDENIKRLPQTGQLWWPVPILICCGILCITIGMIARRGGYDEE